MANSPHDDERQPPAHDDSSPSAQVAPPVLVPASPAIASAASGSVTADKPPDIGKTIKAKVWRWAVQKFGPRWATAGLAVLFVSSLAFGFHTEIAATFADVHTWIAEHWPLPRANPNVFTVALVHLDNDEKGPNGKYQMENDIADSLGGIKGIAILDLDRPRITDEDINAGHKLAKQYLKASGAQVLIWGKVITVSGKSVPKLYWTVAEDATPATEARRYTLSDDLSLPPIFLSDLGSVLRLLVATQGASFAPYQGRFLADVSPFIAKVQNLLETAQTQGWTADDIARVRFILGDAYLALGDQSGQDEPLREAIASYSLVLQIFTRSHDPNNWAMIQNNLGTALQEVGEHESVEAGTTHLQQAVAAYNAALLEFTRNRAPLYWVMTQNNLGTTLGDLGQRESGDPATAHLRQAVAAYNAALLECTRERVPLHWAITVTENNLGGALLLLGGRESGEAAITHLQQAVAAYNAALLECTRERVPLYWAMAQNNLGTALRGVGERESGEAAITHLQQAVTACNAALLEFTRDRAPLYWAMTQTNLGIALRDLGERDKDAKELCEALQAHINAWPVAVDAPYYAAMDLRNAKTDLATLNAGFPPSTYSACVASHADALHHMGITGPNSQPQ